PPAPYAFAHPKPLRMGDKRDVVNGHRQRNRDAKRRRISRREEEVQLIPRRCATEVCLLPPRPVSSSQDTRLGDGFPKRLPQGLRSVENESSPVRIRSDGPASQEFSQVSADARRVAQELARVDPYPKRR